MVTLFFCPQLCVRARWMAGSHIHSNQWLHQEEDHLHLGQVPRGGKSKNLTHFLVAWVVVINTNKPHFTCVCKNESYISSLLFFPPPERAAGLWWRRSSGVQSPHMDPWPADHHVYDLHLWVHGSVEATPLPRMWKGKGCKIHLKVCALPVASLQPMMVFGGTPKRFAVFSPVFSNITFF